MIRKVSHLNGFLLFVLLQTFLPSATNVLMADAPSLKGLQLLPYPKEITTGGSEIKFRNELIIVLDKNHSSADKFAADELIHDLKNDWNISARIGKRGNNPSVILTRNNARKSLKIDGYQITTGESELVISAKGEAGLFYGTQTLLQLIQKDGEGYKIPGVLITDWPDITKRAIHYDTKHHQDKASYVRSFIKDLARYKVNMLVWEWEEK